MRSSPTISVLSGGFRKCRRGLAGNSPMDQEPGQPLFSMMTPIGNVGVFAGMTADRPGDQARRIACTMAGLRSGTPTFGRRFILAASRPPFLRSGLDGTGRIEP